MTLVLFVLALVFLVYAATTVMPLLLRSSRAEGMPSAAPHPAIVRLLQARDAARRVSPAVMMVGAVVAGVMALATVAAIGNQSPRPLQLWLLALAAVVLSVACPVAPGPHMAVGWPRVARGRRLQAGLGAVVLGCGVAALGGVSGYEGIPNLFPGGIGAYVIGAAFIGVGLVLVADRTVRLDTAMLRQRARRHGPELWCVGGILLVGLILRVYDLGYYPPADGFALVDEPQIGLAATKFLWHGQPQWQYPELVYSAMLSFKLFGASLLALRYPIMLAGFLALPLFYRLARVYFSVPVALAGLFLLAVSRWEIAYTRLVLPSSAMMVYELAIILLAVRAIRGHGTYGAYALMGLLTGLGLYSHASFRLVPLLLGLWCLGWLFHERHHILPLVRAHVPGWALFAAVTVIVALPYAGVVRSEPGYAFTERLTSILPLLFARGTVADPGAVLHGNTQTVLGYFAGPGDPWPAVNPPSTPMLDVVTAALFFLGLGYAILHVWRPYLFMLVSWLMLTLVTGAILTIDFRGERIVACIPVVYLLACLPLEVVWRAVRGSRFQAPARLLGPVAGVTVLLLVGAGRSNVDTLFNRQAHDPVVRTTFEPASADATVYFRDHGHSGYNYLLGDFVFPNAPSDYGWAAGEPLGRNADDLNDVLPIHDVMTGTAVHVMVAPPYPQDQYARAFAQVYRRAQREQWRNRDSGTSYTAVVLQAADVRAQQGLLGPCRSAADCARGEALRRGAVPARVFWTGSIYAPANGVYDLHVAFPGQVQPQIMVRLDGQLLRGPVDLPAGWYSLSIVVVGPRPSGAPVIVWNGGGISGAASSNYLRKSAAHGFLQQFVSIAPSDAPVAAAQRVLFPAFLFPFSHNNGRPTTSAGNVPYRVIFTGIVSPGHAGTYAMDLYGVGGQCAVFLDGRPLAHDAGVVNGAPDNTTFLLRLTGRPQVLQIQFVNPGTMPDVAGAALFRAPTTGSQVFLPPDWFVPPAATAPLPHWIGS